MQYDLYLESLIFAAEQPLTRKEIRTCLQEVLEVEIAKQEIENSLLRLQEKYVDDQFSFELIEINGGFVFLTKGAYHHAIGHLLKLQTRKMLSRAALETLAIIAYKQPVTKVDVERIRGVNCDYTIQKLLDKELVIIKGRAEGPGRPLVYATSDKFMDYFGLKTIEELPKLKDFRQPESEIGSSASLVEEAMSHTSEN